MVILVDAMGGDNAPDAVVRGAVKAASEVHAEIVLVGNEEIINKKVKEYFGKNKIEEMASNIRIHNTTETIEMEDIPTVAIKHKKDSSMVVGFNLLKEGKGDVFISAGQMSFPDYRVGRLGNLRKHKYVVSLYGSCIII